MARKPRELIEAADGILSDSLNAGADLSALKLARDALAGQDIDSVSAADPRVVALESAVSAFEAAAPAKPASGESNGATSPAGNMAPSPATPATPPALERITTRKTYLLVALSVLTMYVVACMTIVHNKGVALLAEIEQLAAKEPERRFGELERLLLRADAAPAVAEGAASTAGSQEPAYLMLNELRGLDAQIFQLDQRIIQFYEESHWPAPGMNTTLAVLKAPFRALGSTASAVPNPLPTAREQDRSLQVLCQQVKVRTTVPKSGTKQAQAGEGLNAGMIPASNVGDNVALNSAVEISQQQKLLDVSEAGADPAGAHQNGAAANAATGMPQPQKPGNGTTAGATPAAAGEAAVASPPKPMAGTARTAAPRASDAELSALPVVLSVKMSDVVSQACGANLRFISTTIPSIKEWITRIRQTTSNYSFWLLPGLYAALGSLIFYMRLVLDPNQDDPDIHRIIHRIAMAALAGIVVGWLWQPSLAANVQIQAIGASLFIIAFIVGYSIDVFFILLDRLEKIATAAIQQLGNAPASDQRPKPTGG